MPYIDRMDLAYAAADAVLCRCGMGTVAEVTAVGLPACYVPLPHGNGEQRFNAQPVVDAGGGILVDDAALTGEYLRETLVPLLTDDAALARMSSHAGDAGHGQAARPARGGHPGGGPMSEPRTVVPKFATLDRPAADPADLGQVHFVGIGGAGMSGIARIMLARGIPVSGTDAKDSAALADLGARGARVSVGHSAEAAGGADTLVVSSAIRDDNPELRYARDQGLRIIPRAEALASVMLGKRAVAVAGTHGKTSTTSMLVVALQACGADPSFAIGGELNESGANAHWGTGEVFVAEADESDGSFLLFTPYAGIVTNVEPDHLDNYHDAESVYHAFDTFVRTVSGFIVLCGADERAAGLSEVAREAGIRTYTYGFGEPDDLRLTDLVVGREVTSYTAVIDGAEYQVRLGAPGRHMALNSAAALLSGIRLGLPAADLVAGLARYAGVHRRMEFVGERRGIRVYDDYAHHPTEIAAQLDAARAVAGDGRVVACFQPHLYSRTITFADDFGAALGRADEVVVMDVYGAREDPVPGVSGALVAAAVPPPVPVHYEPSFGRTSALVAGLARPGDLILTLGAGDVTMLGPQILQALEDEA